MATLPIHTGQHVKSVYNKYQVVAVVFTAVTLLAALLAAVSGFQLAKLRKMQPVEVQSPPTVAEKPAPPPVDSGMEKQIKLLEDQLKSEKTASQALRAKVRTLEEKIAAMRVVPPPPDRPAPEKPKTPVKPKVPEVAPATGSPPPVQTTGKEKTVTAPLTTTPPSVPQAAPGPAKAPVPAEKTESQVQTMAPHGGTATSGKSVEPPKPSIAPTPKQPAGPAMKKDQSAPVSVPTPAPDTSPTESPRPVDSTVGESPVPPGETGDTTEAPANP